MTATVEPETQPQADRNEAPASAAPPIEVERRIVLAARGLRKAFGGQVVLDGVNLELREGEVILVRGDNGSGKTTLINILTGNLEPDAGAIRYLTNGSPRAFRFPRRWWQDLNPFDHFTPESTAREGIGRMWQDVRLFGSQTLRDNIAVAEPRHSGENPIAALFATARCQQQETEVARKADALLARLGLTGRESSSADKISLGQSKRVAIARAVAAGARILFLDEPLAGLDHLGVTHVLNLLEHLVREDGVTLVIVEHVFNHVHLHGLVTTRWLLEKGKLHLNDEASTPTALYTSHSASHYRPWLELLAEAGSVVTDEPLPHGAMLTRIRRPDRADPSRNPVLQIQNLVVKRGSRIVIGLDNERHETGFNLQLFDGEIGVLQAPNGWGKSTFLAAISGFIQTAQGDILLAGQSLIHLPVWSRVRMGLRMVRSDQNIFPHLTARDALCLAGKPGSAAALGPLSERRSCELSGGQKQRLALLAEAGQPETQLRMFDEPFANLDGCAIGEAAHNILSQTAGAVLVALPSTNE